LINFSVLKLKKHAFFKPVGWYQNDSSDRQIGRADGLTESYQNAPTDGSAWLSGNCSKRVLRGGAWGDDPQNLRVTVRNGTHPTYYRFSGSGFRVARDLD